ncbi:MAG TPA: hypothetical protein VLU43_06290, partial [Anaeromyxobacteraceae bacterium]|nr:hypothetical protein [Anaeromyxobacteraceae bacterium]
DGRAFLLEPAGPRVRYRGDGFDLRLDPRDPAGTAEGTAAGPVDLTYLRIMERLREAIAAPGAANFLAAALEHAARAE